MSFDKENKITIKEFAPSLVDLINSKTPLETFNNHANNTRIHITDDERNKWNAIYGNAKTYIDEKLKTIVGDLSSAKSGIGSVSDLLKTKADKSDFNSFKSSIKRVAFTGSYSDLVDKPSAVASADVSNRAFSADRARLADTATEAVHCKEADHAKTADKLTVGSPILIVDDFPSNPVNDATVIYHKRRRMLYVYSNNKWNTTGAGLR